MLAYWNNSSRVEMSLHWGTLSWFQANQCMLFLLNAACLTEKQQIPIFIIFGLSEHTIYGTRRDHANHYITDSVPIYLILNEIKTICLSYRMLCIDVYHEEGDSPVDNNVEEDNRLSPGLQLLTTRSDLKMVFFSVP